MLKYPRTEKNTNLFKWEGRWRIGIYKLKHLKQSLNIIRTYPVNNFSDLMIN